MVPDTHALVCKPMPKPMTPSRCCVASEPAIGPTLAPLPRPLPTARTSSTGLIPPASPRPSFCDGPIDLRPPRQIGFTGDQTVASRLRRTLQTPRPWPRASSPEETPWRCRPDGARDHHACLRDLLREHPLHISGLARAVVASAALASLRAPFVVTSLSPSQPPSSPQDALIVASGAPFTSTRARPSVPISRGGVVQRRPPIPSLGRQPPAWQRSPPRRLARTAAQFPPRPLYFV